MMFTEKKKIDLKIRFQNNYFKSQLRQARGYKRTIKKIPTKGWEIFLSRAGLGTAKAKIISALILCAIIYIIFIPNIFFVKHIVINGVKSDDQKEIETTVNFFFQQKNLWPNKNLLLLSATRLGYYLLENNQKILGVESVSKKFPSTVEINVLPRFNKYFLTLPSEKFLVSNDGIISQKVSFNEPATSTLLNNLTVLNVKTDSYPGIGQKFLSPDLADVISKISLHLPPVINGNVKYFEMQNMNDLDLTAITSDDYKIIFDAKSDVAQTLNNLSLLFTDIPAQRNRLLYIDLRFKNKSYVCLKGLPCAQPTALPKATTTIDSNS